MKRWADPTHQVYSERQDLTEETFALLVQLTLMRRKHVTSENMQALWDADQATLQAAISGCTNQDPGNLQ